MPQLNEATQTATSYVPLKTFQGCSQEELSTLVANRSIIIWGCGHLGMVIKRVLSALSFSVKYFCDSNPSMRGKLFCGIPVISQTEAIKACGNGQSFLILASSNHLKDMENECIAAGLHKKYTYLNYLSIPRPEAVINVSGSCDLSCPNCPLGAQVENDAAYMSLARYQDVLNKLLNELPSLTQIDLSLWGEPFLNPRLPEIIRATERKVPCILSTSLQHVELLPAVLKAGPAQILISVPGIRERYEHYSQGGSWDKFVKNISYLVELLQTGQYTTKVAVLYHLYTDTAGNDFAEFKNMCRNWKLSLATTYGYLCPYEKYLQYRSDKTFSSQDSLATSTLLWDVDKTLEVCLQEIGKPCLCQRIFPIINWDCSVALCHTYYTKQVAEDFLKIKLSDLVEKRHHHETCRSCQHWGIHRLDVALLAEKYGREKILKSDK